MNGFKNVRVLTSHGIKRTDILIENGKIAKIQPKQSFDGISFDKDVLIVPGFIDEHIHGAYDKDTMDATKEALINIKQSLVKEGTTSFLPTTMTQSIENINNALMSINQVAKLHLKGAEILGVHLEGPFISKEACGAQPKEFIMNPTIDQFEAFQKVSGNRIKIVTIAPEIDGGQELIRYCSAHHIVASIGHTKAKYEDVKQAIFNGASSVTHCFNAMSGFHHRDIGVVGATLLQNELDAELIADGIHVSKEAISILSKNKGCDHMILITDAMRAKGLHDGTYDLGGQLVYVKNGEARLEDGTLAGSTLKMIDAVKNSMKFLNIGIEEAVQMASMNPAKKCGVFDRKGSIDEGKDADLVVLDEDYSILMTCCMGEVVYKREELEWK